MANLDDRYNIPSEMARRMFRARFPFKLHPPTASNKLNGQAGLAWDAGPMAADEAGPSMKAVARIVLLLVLCAAIAYFASKGCDPGPTRWR